MRDQASQVRTFQLETVEMCKTRESWWIGGKDGALLWVDLSLGGIGMLTCLELWQVVMKGCERLVGIGKGKWHGDKTIHRLGLVVSQDP